MQIYISKTFIDGSPSHFEEKIWVILLIDKMIDEDDFSNYFSGNKKTLIQVAYTPKLHAILSNAYNLWSAGKKIQICYDERVSGLGIRQLMPEFRCISVQKISIKYKRALSEIPMIFVDDKNLCITEVKRIAQNEGFTSLNDFYAQFSEDFTGTIIHWTKLRYTE